jgi:hypothetical protein
MKTTSRAYQALGAPLQVLAWTPEVSVVQPSRGRVNRTSGEQLRHAISNRHLSAATLPSWMETMLAITLPMYMTAYIRMSPATLDEPEPLHVADRLLTTTQGRNSK